MAQAHSQMLVLHYLNDRNFHHKFDYFVLLVLIQSTKNRSPGCYSKMHQYPGRPHNSESSDFGFQLIFDKLYHHLAYQLALRYSVELDDVYLVGTPGS